MPVTPSGASRPDSLAHLEIGGKRYRMHSLAALARHGQAPERLPYSLRILLENLLRHFDGVTVVEDDIAALAAWNGGFGRQREIAFRPARVLLQDFTGVPAVVDLAAMRDAMASLGGDPARINPLQPVELVIDHSMQVDVAGQPGAMAANRRLDYQRNRERYEFLRWGQQAFRNFKVVPPNTGICHQVNLEYLARVVFASDELADAAAGEPPLLYPDTVVGCDSHTPMVNGLGVLGWGVGGIEAEAAMLGQPISMLIPEVVGCRLVGAMKPGRTATDLVLTIAERLRARGVVGKFVEFCGPGIESLTIADRATIGNMSPEYGATCAMFPVDAQTLRYLGLTGRPPWRLAVVEAYMKAQGLFRTADSPEPLFSDLIELDLAAIEPSVAGPRRPQDRIPLHGTGASFARALDSLRPSRSRRPVKDAAVGEPGLDRSDGVWGESPGSPLRRRGEDDSDCGSDALCDGSVVIAAITSCTNTSNPAVMLAAGLLARNAVERGLRSKPWVKTSFAPGSQVVTEYLARAGLGDALDRLGFNLVGYGCTTCIGNSGPLPAAISKAIEERHLVVCSVLSGNRNFEGRIHSEVRANYLMSPPLVVAFAIAGRIDIDLENQALGEDEAGRPVFLRDIWPDPVELEASLGGIVDPAMFAAAYDKVYRGDEAWNALSSAASDRYDWAPSSTYVRRPPYFEGMSRKEPGEPAAIAGARVLAVLGDSVTTDHISPAGSIRRDSPAGRHLLAHGAEVEHFNSYGARRGNHEVMVRGTFANGRLRNLMLPGIEGGLTVHLPSGETLPIFDAAERYRQQGTPLLILAGKEYGTGSSRDWAAKGPKLLGVAAVIAESFERIHRSNLVGMGILPLQFLPGESAASLGLSGSENFDIPPLAAALDGRLCLRVREDSGAGREITVLVRLDTAQEEACHRHGGILPYVLRQMLDGAPLPATGGMAAAALKSHGDLRPRNKVEEGSIESFPASDPPSY